MTEMHSDQPFIGADHADDGLKPGRDLVLGKIDDEDSSALADGVADCGER